MTKFMKKLNSPKIQLFYIGISIKSFLRNKIPFFHTLMRKLKTFILSIYIGTILEPNFLTS